MNATKRKGAGDFSPDELARVQLAIVAMVLARPGLSVEDIRDELHLSEGFVKQTLQSHSLNWWQDRLRHVPTFNRQALRGNRRQFVLPCAPWRVAHVDTTIIGALVSNGNATRRAELLTAGVIADGLTGWVHAQLLEPGEDIAALIRAAHKASLMWDLYVLDHRPDAMQAEQTIRLARRAVIRAIPGTLWDNTKVERVNAALKRYIAKRPIETYSVRSVLAGAVADFVEQHNHGAGSRGHTIKHRLQNIRRQWTSEELFGLCRERGREPVSTVPFWPSEDHGAEPWAMVCSDKVGTDTADVMQRFADDHAPGFYWASESAKGACELDRPTTQED